jgi:hypothetical protein
VQRKSSCAHKWTSASTGMETYCYHITWRAKKCHWRVNQALLRAHRNASRFKHGPEVPREHEDTMYLDCWSSGTKWHSAVKREVVMIHNYLVIVDSIRSHASCHTVRASL